MAQEKYDFQPCPTEQQVLHEENDAFKHEVIFPRIASLIESLPKKPVVLVDVGAGSGQLGKHLNSNQIERAILIDSNPNILPIAERVFRRRNIPVEIMVRDMADILPLPKEHVNVATFLFSLNEIPHPEGVIAYAYHWLAPQGRIVIVVPDESYITKVSERGGKLGQPVEGVNKRVATEFLFRSAGIRVPFYPRPINDYLDWLGRAGFIVVSIDRLEDPQEQEMIYTPKATLIVARKSPAEFGDAKHIVKIKQQFFTAIPRALEIKEGEGYAMLVVTLEDGSVEHVPFRNNNVVFERLLSLTYRQSQILVRETILEASSGIVRIAWKMFYQGESLTPLAVVQTSAT